MSQVENLLESLAEEVLEHEHLVADPDTYFVINPDTREIENTSRGKQIVMQYDHNSETYTFQVPRHIEGHDMLLSNHVWVHFNNVDENGEENADLAEMTDLRENPDDPETLISSWTITREATQLVGILSFAVQYECVSEDGTPVYEWHTDLYDRVEVRKSKRNSASVAVEYSAILEQWYTRIFGAEESILSSISAATETAQQELIEAKNKQIASIVSKGAETLAAIPDDYTELYGMARDAVRTRANAIVQTVEGSAVAANDCSGDYLRGLRVFGKSTQDGTPTPDAPVDIVSVGNPVVTVLGKNMLDADLMINEQFKKNADGTYTITKNGASNLRFSKRAVCRIPKGTYILSVGSVSGMDDTVRIAFSFASGKEVSCAVTAVIPKVLVADEEIVKFATYIPSDRNDGEYTTFAGLMMEYGLSVTEYESYAATQTVTIPHTLPGIPVSNGGNYTDANGQQWICDEVDFARGVYVKRVAAERLVTVTHYNENGIYVSLPVGKSKYDTKYICSHFADGVAYANGITGAYASCVLPKSKLPASITSIETGQAWLDAQAAAGTPVVAVYALSEPIETALTDEEIFSFSQLRSNYPNTTALNDAGAWMEVSYNADTKVYLHKLIAEAVSMITKKTN